MKKLKIAAMMLVIGAAASMVVGCGEKKSETATGGNKAEQSAEAEEKTEGSGAASETADADSAESSEDEYQVIPKEEKTDNTAVAEDASAETDTEDDLIVDSEYDGYQEYEYVLGEIPSYNSKPYVEINDNKPAFSEEDLTTVCYEEYSEMDDLGRCGAAIMCAGAENLRQGDREDISKIRPAGWHSGNDPAGWNRSHLLMSALGGDDAEYNLVTGTTEFNQTYMLEFEDQVLNYVRNSDNHVMYRVTPVFSGSNLIPDGVLMEAESVEDDRLEFCVFVYNVEPGVSIDYRTGESEYGDYYAMGLDDVEVIPMDDEASAETASADVIVPVLPVQEEYVLNTNTHKFHYTWCDSVDQMKDKNKEYFEGNRDDAIARGFAPCQNCNP